MLIKFSDEDSRNNPLKAALLECLSEEHNPQSR
jgi:hypothetical protein